MLQAISCAEPCTLPTGKAFCSILFDMFLYTNYREIVFSNV